LIVYQFIPLLVRQFPGRQGVFDSGGFDVSFFPALQPGNPWKPGKSLQEKTLLESNLSSQVVP